MKTLLLATLLLVVACDSGSSVASGARSAPPLTATVDGTATTQTTVGGPAHLTVTVTNTGPAIPHLGLVFLKGDKWYDHHVITDGAGCTIDRNHNAFDCGDLAVGATAKFAIVGVAKDAGNFQYEVAFEELVPPFDFINNHPNGADTLTWSEAIVPA